MVFTPSSYENEHDLAAMIALLQGRQPPACTSDYPGPADLHEAMAQPALRQTARLWRDEHGSLAAFAYTDLPCNLCFEMDPAWQAGLAGEVVAWGEACLRARAAPGEPLPALVASCRAGNTPRITLLESCGFIRQGEESVRLERRLAEPLPDAALPPGFTIRPLAAARELEAAVALHRQAFGTDHMTLEEARAMRSIPGYDPALDLAAYTPDGRLAATCFAWVEPGDGSRGATDPLATLPEFQGRGLARALLLEGLRRLQQRGVQVAGLGTRSDNHAMLRAAAAAGFREEQRVLWFSKRFDE